VDVGKGTGIKWMSKFKTKSILNGYGYKEDFLMDMAATDMK
jgi:hypothetical protein